MTRCNGCGAPPAMTWLSPNNPHWPLGMVMVECTHCGTATRVVKTEAHASSAAAAEEARAAWRHIDQMAHLGWRNRR